VFCEMAFWPGTRTTSFAEPKIQPSHIERDAYVYIRQSSMQQVRTRLEGQRRQYDFRERALSPRRAVRTRPR